MWQLLTPNKLNFNVTKTHVMVFSTSNLPQNVLENFWDGRHVRIYESVQNVLGIPGEYYQTQPTWRFYVFQCCAVCLECLGHLVAHSSFSSLQGFATRKSKMYVSGCFIPIDLYK